MTDLSWFLVLSLGVGAFACKVIGLVVIGSRSLPPAVDRCLALIPAALITALVVKDALSIGQDLVLDARAVGVGCAVFVAWRRAPLTVVIVVGTVVTALVRALG